MYATSLGWQVLRATRAVWTAVIIVAAGQFAITYLGPLQEVFDTRGIGFVDGLLINLTGVALFVIIESEKRLRLRLKGAPRM